MFTFAAGIYRFNVFGEWRELSIGSIRWFGGGILALSWKRN
jgi:hypothetical protein